VTFLETFYLSIFVFSLHYWTPALPENVRFGWQGMAVASTLAIQQQLYPLSPLYYWLPGANVIKPFTAIRYDFS